MNRKEFIIVSVITCFVVLVWVFAEIIHAQPSVPQDSRIQALLDPITPNFDQKTLQEVNQVRHLGPSKNEPEPNPEESSPSAVASPTPKPTSSPTSSPSPKASVNTSTDSANLEQ